VELPGRGSWAFGPRRCREAKRYLQASKRVRAAYNHADYVEQRWRMMQDWADRLDLFQQNQTEPASRPLAIHGEGMTEAPVSAVA
jgi:hypothetical protein